MARPAIKRPAPEPSGTRTNHDLVMIVLGVILTLFFLTAGAVSIKGPDDGAAPRTRGPVKNPAKSELRLPDAPLPEAATDASAMEGGWKWRGQWAESSRLSATPNNC